MEQYVAGWDGGGTKTAIQVRDLEGNFITESICGALNYNSQSKEELCNIIDTLLEVMDRLPGSRKACKSLCIATAGVSNQKASAFITDYLKAQDLVCDITIVADYEAALYGAFEKPEGIVLISGTGSICYGKNKLGQSYRTGGFGHLIDDEGSGYAIGRDILKAAVRIFDQRLSDSILLDLVLEQIKGTRVEDIIEYTYQSNWNKAAVAAISPLLLKAMEMGDEAAKQICEKASDELVQLVIPVAKQLNQKESQIVLLGGILNNFQPIKNQVIQKILKAFPLLQIVEPLHNSVAGAAYLALEKYKQREAL